MKLPRGRGSLGERLAELAGIDPQRALLLGRVGRQAARAVEAVQPHVRNVFELIRLHPDEWVGKPDPDELARLPLKDAGEGMCSFGAFLIDLPKRCFQVSIGHDAPVEHIYFGSFAVNEGKWVASVNDYVRAHHR